MNEWNLQYIHVGSILFTIRLLLSLLLSIIGCMDAQDTPAIQTVCYLSIVFDDSAERTVNEL